MLKKIGWLNDYIIYIIVLSFLLSIHPSIPFSFLPSGNNSMHRSWKYKNEFHTLPADKWFSLVLKIVTNKCIKVWKMLIENSVGHSEDKKGKRKVGRGGRVFKKTCIEKWLLIERNLVRWVGICHIAVAEWAFQSEGIAGTKADWGHRQHGTPDFLKKIF